ncbi:hypothetical protein H5T56_04910 [Candidatus Bipolaricaulota bacterium]|nr:hypothetical protein [Candidatus Bipolaricaulota bacterium]
MDLWKLLILGVIVLGLFLVLGRPPGFPKLPEGLRIEEGTFRILSQAGTREEIFGIYPVEAGFRVVSILHERGKVLVEADFLYGLDWTPLAGTITQREPAKMRWLFAFSEEEVVIRRQEGPREFTQNLPLSEKTFPFDHDLLAPWYGLFREGKKDRAKLLDVRTGKTYELAIGPGEEVELLVFGRRIPVERHPVTLEEQNFWVYREGELLLGLRGEGFEAYLVEILPEGIQESTRG